MVFSKLPIVFWALKLKTNLDYLKVSSLSILQRCKIGMIPFWFINSDGEETNNQTEDVRDDDSDDESIIGRSKSSKSKKVKVNNVH